MALLHRDLAMALAAKGYVVAAPTHPRGKGNDVSGVSVWVGRPKQVSRVIDAILEDRTLGPRIDRERIGVAGHSNGGYTALAVAGARPSVGSEAAHCREHADDVKLCGWGGAVAREAANDIGVVPELRDPRVRSIVVRAPHAVRFSDEALAKVASPVLVYAAEQDDLTRVKYHAELLARTLPGAECVVVKGAGHFSFIPRFPAALTILAGAGARDPAGFDRDAFHEMLNREIVEFFDRTLRAGEQRLARARSASCSVREMAATSTH